MQYTDIREMDSKQVLDFFARSLEKVVRHKNVDAVEFRYVVGILGHFAITQWTSHGPETIAVDPDVPSLFRDTELSPYVYRTLVPKNNLTSKAHEERASHIFLMVGFFQSSLSPEVNFEIGIAQSYYMNACRISTDSRHRSFLRKFAHSVPFWTSECKALRQHLDEDRFELRFEPFKPFLQ